MNSVKSGGSRGWGLMTRLQRIRETLYPTRDGYCSEPIDIDDARWLLAEVDRLTVHDGAVEEMQRERDEAEGWLATTQAELDESKSEEKHGTAGDPAGNSDRPDH